MKKIFRNIKKLYGCYENLNQPLRGKEMSGFSFIENAWILTNNNVIEDYGNSNPPKISKSIEEIDCSGKIIFPTYCDSHTHFVFSNYRENEFLLKVKGATYAEIAANGGGILQTAKKLEKASFDDLYYFSYEKIKKAIALGTGAIEIKSGYGLLPHLEIKMLEVIKKLKENLPIPIKATYLMAHALPQEFTHNKKEYLKQIVEENLPLVAKKKLADFADVFCEDGFFSVDETRMLIDAAIKHNIKIKLHSNQLNSIGGVQLAIEKKILTIDHLETTTQQDIDDLIANKDSFPIPVSLPLAAFYLNLPQTPSRKLIDNGCAICIATDFNPGSAPNFNMAKAITIACVQQKILPTEALAASTINGAFAMELQNEVGSITKGKKANFILTKQMSDIEFIPYSFGEDYIDTVYINAQPYK